MPIATASQPTITLRFDIIMGLRVAGPRTLQYHDNYNVTICVIVDIHGPSSQVVVLLTTKIEYQ